jgi:putative lipoprotein
MEKRMNIRIWLGPAALGLGCAVLAGCAGAPDTGTSDAFITGTARYQERIALPANAVFEALLEDVSLADAPARVVGQQNISPAGNPPYALRIPYDPAKLDPRGRYNVRASIRVDDKLWFIQDLAAPVLRQPSDNRVDVLMRRVADFQPEPAAQGPAGADAAPGDAGALVAPALRQAWQVTHIGTRSVADAQPRVPSLVFDAKAPRVSGNTGCNGFSATYTAQGERLQFGPPMSTRMACAGSVEGDFVQALRAVRSQRAEGRELQLLDDAGRTVMRLSPQG